MAASRTAEYVALYRALETDERRRPPLFRDPYALGFLPRRLALAVRAARAPLVRRVVERYADRRAPGARTSAIARTAYIDDAVRAAVAGGIERSEMGGDPDGSAGGAGGKAPRGIERSEMGGDPDGSAGGAGGKTTRGIERSEMGGEDPDGSAGGAGGKAPRGIDQVVILGAGFDCRAHRMPELAAASVYEVDRRDTQAVKRAHVPGPRAVRYVAVDFLRDDVGAALAAAGWDARRRSLFVWEGVTNYLTEAAVRGTLDWIGTAAPGSRVVFTYIHAGVLDGSVGFDGGARLMANVRRLGEPWTFGLHPGAVAAFVAGSGLRLCEDLGADDYRRRYLGAATPGYQFYRIALAEVPPAAAAG